MHPRFWSTKNPSNTCVYILCSFWIEIVCRRWFRWWNCVTTSSAFCAFRHCRKLAPFAAAPSHIHKQQKNRSLKAAALLVPVVGLEPTRCRHQRILSPSRLPFHHTGKRLLYYILSFLKFQESILSLTKTFFFQRFPAFFLFFIANLFTILLRHYSTKKDLNFDQIVVKLFIVR